MKLLMCVTDGFEDIEAIGTLAILRRAKLDVTFAAIDAREAKGRYGVDVVSLDNLHDLNTDEYDMLILPGGPEYLAEERNPSFLRMIENFADHNKYIAAICAAPGLVVSQLPGLEGKKFTCFDGFEQALVEKGAVFTPESAVTDGALITGRGAGHAVNFGLAILRYLKGDEAAEKVKAGLML